ncbi:MlaD family protein [Nocardia pseudobrasiliensis]|uniref:Phospholipid/cholesterol/gamma-HCH transport system substrate-binding protein n=1 Tax=Nocardia pseudobrasiliensis TaxID=45979 RepID=A0A370ICE7_9NOCA|nr:MlaD family protein [Nocardia pseudobrasiliensis]RDI68373.1 phospholipid/cholesterol/gamma-HCH transport system substrate-binding protein [Nocardia pseudobrasiliensis]
MLLGVCAYAVALVIAAAAAIVYLAPPDRHTVAFDISDAAAIHVGDDVRVAGVSVGKVSRISLQPSVVRVECKIRDGVFLGADTAVAVRMLTAAGGYYVALESAGDTPLRGVIAISHARPPYSLPDLIRDAPGKLDALATPDIGASLDKIATGLDAAPGSVRSLIDAVQGLATILDKQRRQVESTLTVSREYLSAFDDNREVLFAMLRKAAVVLRVLEDTHIEFGQAYQGLAEIFGRVAVLTRFYQGHSDEVGAAAQQLEAAAHSVGTDVPTLIDQLTQFVNYLQQVLGPDGIHLVAGDQVLATDLCVPIPGRSC